MNEEAHGRILIVDDDANMRKLVRHHLRKEGCVIEEAQDGQTALLQMEKATPDIIILDYQMPDMNGLETLRRIRSNPNWNHVYVLMLTANSEIEIKIVALEQGAGYYLIKPFHSAELKACVKNGMSVTKAHRDSQNDPRTGLVNCRRMEECLIVEMERARRFEHPLALVMLDIDLFKQVNDKHGHSVGDLTLIELARILKTGVRTIDIACRYGGEEFLLLLPETNLIQAVAMAENLRLKIQNYNFPVVGQSITVSLGVVLCGNDSNKIMKNVDEALYEAKKRGRNCVVSYQEHESGSKYERIMNRGAV